MARVRVAKLHVVKVYTAADEALKLTPSLTPGRSLLEYRDRFEGAGQFTFAACAGFTTIVGVAPNRWYVLLKKNRTS